MSLKRRHRLCVRILLSSFFAALILGFGSMAAESGSDNPLNPALPDPSEEFVEICLNVLREQYPELGDFLSNEVPSSYMLYGLSGTRSIYARGEKKGEIGLCMDMTPQGLVATEEYILVSAYSKSHDFHSVLWVIDRKTGDYIKTVVLEGVDHVGGIAYDDTFHIVWVTCTNGKGHAGAVGCLKLEEIEKYDLDRRGKVLRYDHKYNLGGIDRTSFLTVDSGYMLSGVFRDKEPGTLCVYKLNPGGYPETEDVESESGTYPEVKPIATVAIPDEIQGITLDDDLLVLSQSYGNKDSWLVIYPKPEMDEMEDMTDDDAGELIKAPPYLEQIFLDNYHLFTLFESAASAYRDRKNVLCIDHVLEFDV